MKKIVMIFAAMAAVLSSCQKSELESVSANDGKNIVLNISVSNPGADDTKAIIKTGWAANDEISIWYDSNAQETPDLVVTYNGEKWIQKEGAAISGNTPSTGTGKYAKALYNGTVKVASKDDYTYENSTLTFSIENWKFLTEVQVVVKGLTSASAGSYTLACDKFTPLASTGNGYTVSADGITASKGDKGAAVTGISNTDGIAFVFATADYSATAADYKFTLTDNTSTPAVTKEYTATTDKISGTSGSMAAIKALTIASSKFAVPTKGTAKATIDGEQVDVNWVQLWAGGPKFAEYNVGASSATDGGNAMEFTDAAKTGSNYVWGANWCTPTQEQMNELLKAATPSGSEEVECVYTQDKDSGIYGFKFTGKKTGHTENSVFFPAEDGRSDAGVANYWSATANDSEAWEMNLHYEASVNDWFSEWDSHDPYLPCFVRPVLFKN